MSSDAAGQGGSRSSDRQAAQRSILERRGLRGAAGGVEVERREGADLGLAGRDRVGASFNHMHRGEGARFDAAGEVKRRKHEWKPFRKCRRGGLPVVARKREVDQGRLAIS